MFSSSSNNREILILLGKKHNIFNSPVLITFKHGSLQGVRFDIFSSFIYIVRSFVFLHFYFLSSSYFSPILRPISLISFLIFLLRSLPSLINLIYLSSLVSVSNLFPCFPLTSTYPPANLLTFL